MIKYLEPKTPNKSHSYKYLVDCENIKNNSGNIDIQTGAMRDKHIIVLEAVIDNPELRNQKIIIKIGETNQLIKREYDIAKKLELNNINGYIHINCLFSCGHNINKYIRRENINPDTFKICETQDKNNIDVLVMPYIGNGISLYDVGAEHYKELIKQVVTNSVQAFKKTGFIHKDLHFGNIVVDENNNPIILDFDTSEFINLQSPMCYSYFWSDMQRFFSNVIERASFSNKWESVYILSNANMILFMINNLIYTQMEPSIFDLKMSEIINYITMSEMVVMKKPDVSTHYNPNIYGGSKKKTRRKTAVYSITK